MREGKFPYSSALRTSAQKTAAENGSYVLREMKNHSHASDLDYLFNRNLVEVETSGASTDANMNRGARRLKGEGCGCE